MLLLLLVLHSGVWANEEITEREEVIAFLTTFIRAFENGEIDVMEASFSANSLVFPIDIVPTESSAQIQTSDYKRVKGMGPTMRKVVASFRERDTGPPYMTLDPKDLEVQMFSDTAVVTFHLEDDRCLGRRTFVLAKEGDSWKIVHLHASNVLCSE